MPTPAPAPHHHTEEHPAVLTPTEARGGVVSGRVITVLIVSLTLALLAMIGLLSHFYSFPFRLYG